MRRGVITIKVGGDTFSCDLQDLEIVNADAERYQVSTDIAWWGSVAASAEAYAAKLAARADGWTNAQISACVGKDEKIAEWKAKSFVKGQPEHVSLQETLADAQEMAATARNLHWSFVRKGEMLQAMISGENATRRNTYDIGRMPEDHTANPNDPRLGGFKQRRA